MISPRSATDYGHADFLWVLRSRWPLGLLVASVVFLGGAAWKKQTPRLYEASVRIEMAPDFEVAQFDHAKGAFQASSANDLVREASELRSRALLSEVVGPCDLVERWAAADEAGAIELLEDRIRVEELPVLLSLKLEARDTTPEFAATLANAIAGRFLERKQAEVRAETNARVLRYERELEEREVDNDAIQARLVAIAGRPDGGKGEPDDLRRRLASGRNLVRSLEAKLQLAVLEAGEAFATARIVEPAAPATALSVGSFWTTVPGLLLGGLAAGLLAALLGDREKARWSVVANLMERLEIPIAGFAPVSGSSLLAETSPSPWLVEAYRDLRHRLSRLPAGDCTLLTVMPVSPETSIAEPVVNLACVLADGGSTVLVIDADFRRAELHPFFDAANHPGLSDFLSGEMRLEETVIRTRRANLWFMPSGPLRDDPCGLLEGRRMGDLVWDMRSRFDFILVASPSIHEVSDAAPLAAHADFTAVVVPYAGHSPSRLKETRIALETVSARLAAVFLTTRTEAEAAPRRAVPAPSVPLTTARR